MRIKKNFRSFQQITFLIIFTLMLIMSIVIAVIAIWDANSIMRKEVRERNLNAAVQMQCTYDVIFRQLSTINHYNYLDVNAQTFMSSNIPDILYEDFAGNFTELTQNYRYIQNYIYEMGFYASEDDVVWISSLGDNTTSISTEQYGDFSICDYIDEMEPFENGYYHHLYGAKHPYVITLIKKNKEGIGASFLSVNMEKLKGFVPDESTNYYMIASDGTILYSNIKGEIGSLSENKEQFYNWKNSVESGKETMQSDSIIVSSVKSNRYDWYYVAVQDIEQIEISKDRLIFICSITILISLMGMIIALVSSRKAVQPLETMMDMLSGNEILVNQYDYVEIKNIAKKMAAIISSNNQLKTRLEETLQEFDGLQTAALQYQMNPHFLYNTLNLASIYAAKELGPRHDTVTVIRKLSEILRYSLNSEENIVSLDEELIYVNIYLNILEKRYTENFKVSCDIPEELLKGKILRMSIQPLVENAVYHGIQPQGGGMITIGAVRENGQLKVWVADDGVGMNQEEIKKLNQRIRQEKIQSRHIGLANVHRRLQILFGIEYGVTITSEPNKGIRASMILPYLETTEE